MVKEYIINFLEEHISLLKKKYSGPRAEIHFADLKKNPLGYPGRRLLKEAERQRHIDAMPIFSMEQEFAIVDLRKQLEQQLEIAVQKSVELKSSKDLKQKIKKLKTHLKTLEILDVPPISNDEIERELREGTIPQEKTFDYSERTRKILKLLKNYKKTENKTTDMETSQNQKLFDELVEKLKELKKTLQDSGIRLKDSKEHVNLKKKVSILRIKMNSKKTIIPSAIISEGPKITSKRTKINSKKVNLINPIDVQATNYPVPIDPVDDSHTKKIQNFKNLELIMQWELAPILVDRKINGFIPLQVEDLHAFILENYCLSEEKTKKVPIQILAVQFLVYLIERENSNVRVTNLAGQMPFQEDADGRQRPELSLEKMVMDSLLDLNNWKSIHQLVGKSITFNNEIKSLSADSSLGHAYFSQVSNNTNALSLDSLGSFFELFKARIEWISRTLCSKLSSECLLVYNSSGMIDQITVATNLAIREGSWLEGHFYLNEWKLPEEPNKRTGNTLN
jgi:hypothetical protein